MKKKTKLAIVGLSATLLCASAIGANFAVNQSLQYGVKGEDNAGTYTLTLNKDTSDAFKTGWNGDIFTVKTTLGNPIRFKRVTADANGKIAAPAANTSDGLDMNFKAGSTQAYLFSLDAIPSITSIQPTFKRVGTGSTPMIQVYRSNEVFTENSAALQNNASISIRPGMKRDWSLGEGKYLAFKFASSSEKANITMTISSIAIGYTCA